MAFAQDDSDQVVGAGFVIAILHRRGNFVVGLGHDLLQRYAIGIVTQSSKWGDDCHNGTENCSRERAWLNPNKLCNQELFG